MIDLKSIALDSKENLVELPGFDGFKVRLAFVSKNTSKNILEQSTAKTYKNGMYVGDERDHDKFADMFVGAAVKGWEGLTLDTVSRLMLIDIGDKDPSTIVDYSADNAVMLFKNSNVFSSFIDRSVFEIETFRSVQ